MKKMRCFDGGVCGDDTFCSRCSVTLNERIDELKEVQGTLIERLLYRHGYDVQGIQNLIDGTEEEE